MELEQYNRRKIILLIVQCLFGGLFLTYIGLMTKVYFLTSVIVLNPFGLNAAIHAFEPIIRPYQETVRTCYTALHPGLVRSYYCDFADNDEQTWPWLRSFRPEQQ